MECSCSAFINIVNKLEVQHNSQSFAMDLVVTNITLELVVMHSRRLKALAYLVSLFDILHF